VHDDIFNVTAPPSTRGFFRNLARTRRQGIELDGFWQPLPHFAIEGSLAFARATFRTHATLAAPFLEEEGGEGTAVPEPPTVAPGDAFPLVPGFQSKLHLSYRDPRWRLALEGTYVGRQWLRGDEGNIRPEARLDPYFLVDAYAERSVGSAALYIRVDNVLDTRCETFGVIATNPLGPGAERVERFLTPGFPRRAFGGLRWRL
jgi:outer membrane receptor protein involved in Fe transport